MVHGHCQIIPMQHVVTLLELDDDAWDEIRVINSFIIFNDNYNL
jgi:diadenosine tetraphosphate (Ap4A) HIT family hydrolase